MDSTEAQAKARRRRRRRSRDGEERTLANGKPAILRRAAIAMLFAVAIVSPQLLGGAFVWGAAVIALLTSIALVLSRFAGPARNEPGPTPAIVTVALALLGYTAIQALPLPIGLVDLLHGRSAVEMRATAAAAGWSAPSFATISIDPGGTLVAFLHGAAIVSAFLIGRTFGVRGEHGWVTRAAASSTLAMSLVALLHLALGLDAVFGVYHPRYSAPHLIAPLMNPNHFGAFTALGAPIMMGLALDANRRSKSVLWGTGAALVALLAILSVSRGAIAQLALSVFLLAATVVAGRRRRVRGGRFVAVAVMAAIPVVVGLYLGLGPLVAQFEEADASKATVAFRSLALLADAPLAGVGRGAFSAAFARHLGTTVRYENPENIVVQWLVEWGPVIGGLGLVAVLASARELRFRAMRHASTGVAIGLVSLAAHDLVDFSLELVGIAVVAAMLFGALLGASEGRRGRAQERSRPPRPIAIGVAAVTGVAAVLCWVALDESEVRVVEQRLGRMLVEDASHEEFRDTLRRGLALHPAEPSLTLLAGAEALRERDPSALRWLSRTMDLAPGWPAPHVLAARWLARRGALDQAMLEVREAETRQAGSARDLVCQLARAEHIDFAQLLRGAPDAPSPQPADFLDRAAGCISLDAPLSRAIDARLAQMQPTRPVWAAREARRALVRGDAAAARALIEATLPGHPSDVSLRIAHADSLARLGDLRGAIDALQEAIPLVSRPDALLLQRARYEAELGDAEAMRRTMAVLRGMAQGSAQNLARVELAQGSLELRLDNTGRAMRAFEEANRFDPQSDGLQRVAELSERVHSYRRAYHAYATLCAERPGSQAACAAKERLRARIEQ